MSSGLAKPHQRLRLQLRQDAGHERQHGHVHAICLRPGAEHFFQGQRGRGGVAEASERDFLKKKKKKKKKNFADPVKLAGRAGIGARTAPLRGSPRTGGGRLSPQPAHGISFRPGQSLLDVFQQCHVLRAETDALCQSRLLLCDLTARTIQKGLELLGINVVEKM